MSLDRRAFVLGTAAIGALAAAPAASQSASEQERRMREDPAYLGRYADDNRRLLAAQSRVDVVFMGDSITEGWRDKRPGFFRAGRVSRGIGGQTTSQMLVRMMPDVVQLRPRFVHIMAGTNDIAGNTGPMTRQMTYDNVAAMSAIARQNGVGVLLASIPPAASFPWRPGLETVGPIREINTWLKSFAARTGAIWVDYTPALADATGAMKPGLAYDGVHPTEAGYDAMAGVVEPILRLFEA